MDICIQKVHTRVFNQMKVDSQGSPIAVMENGEPKLDADGNPVYETELKARVSFFFSDVPNYPVLTVIADWPATSEQIESKVLAMAQQHKDAAEQTLVLHDDIKSLDNLQVS